MKGIIRYITNNLVNGGIISPSEYDIYFFGLYEGSLFIFNLIMTLIIATIIGSLQDGILFLIFFFPIRRLAGGFHAETRKKCWIISMLIVSGAMIGIKMLSNIQDIWKMAIIILSSFEVIRLSPVTNLRKPLSQIEVRQYRKKLIIIIVVENFLGFLGYFFGNEWVVSCITVALTCCCGLCVFGKIFN